MFLEMQDLNLPTSFCFCLIFPFPPTHLIYGYYKIISIFLQFGMEGLYKKSASMSSVDQLS